MSARSTGSASESSSKSTQLSDLLGKHNEDTKKTEEVKNTPEENAAIVDKQREAEKKETEKKGPALSEHVVSTVPNKTPAELAAETPDETAARYNVNTEITKEDAENPRVQVYPDTHVRQVPSGTHLHPDIAKDMLNRGISEQTTDSAQVKRTITDTYDFAESAEHNDKF